MKFIRLQAQIFLLLMLLISGYFYVTSGKYGMSESMFGRFAFFVGNVGIAVLLTVIWGKSRKNEANE